MDGAYEQLSYQANKSEFAEEPTERAGQKRVYKKKTDVIDMMVRNGQLKEDHRMAADEIHRIYGALQRCFIPSARRFENEPVDGRAAYKDPADRLSEIEAIIYTNRYKPWANLAAKRPVVNDLSVTWLTLTFDIAVDNMGPRQWEMLRGYPKGKTATRCLAQALEMYLEG